MKNIYIKYDPYEMITEFKVNGTSVMEMQYRHPWLDKVLREKSLIPLQSWIDPVPSEKWEGLLSYLKNMNDDTFSISFCGRKIDFGDLKESLKNQNQKLGNIIIIDYPKEKQQFLLSDSEMKTAIDEVVSIMSEERFATMVKASENINLKNKYATMQEKVKAIANKEFRVVFTGIYSSGKSTVINALVGKNVLPQAEGTCTDKICYIKHSKEYGYSKIVYVLKNGKTKEFICNNGEQSQEKIRNASKEKDVDEIYIYVDMSHLYPDNLEKEFRLVFVDTPGTGSEDGDDVSKKNEDNTHIELTRKILSSDDKEMVVLISDKKTVSSGIPEILDIFDQKAGEDRGCYNDRFLFVLNQCDTYKFHPREKDAMTGRYEGLENEVFKLKKTISRKAHGRETRNIDNPRIFPISAATALAIKIGCNNAENKPKRETELRDYYDAYDDFCEKLTDRSAEYYINEKIDKSDISENYLLDEYADLPELQKNELKRIYNNTEFKDDYFLLHSGILSLELAIKSYIERYAFPIKVRKLLRAFKAILEEINEEKSSYLEDLKTARKKISNTKKQINIEKKSKDKDSEKKKELENAKKEMKKIFEQVKNIDVSIPEMDDLRSQYYQMQEKTEEYFKKGDGSWEKYMTYSQAEEAKKKIEEKVKKLTKQAKYFVEQVKIRKMGIADQYAVEFNEYLKMLKNKGLLNVGSFNVENTVTYKDIVGDGTFIKYDSYVTEIDNPYKEHIETDDGILNFFASIGRTISTLLEPSQVERIAVAEYRTKLFLRLDGNVTKLINSVMESYKHDIDGMKKNMADRMNAVLELIRQIEIEIKNRNKKIECDLETEENYKKKKEDLENDCAFLSKLIYKLNGLNQGGN